jgi:hypothetical protein
MVVKDEDDPNVWAEQRLTTNHSKVEEKLPATLIPLMAELHDRLSDPRIGSSSVRSETRILEHISTSGS